MRVVDVFLFLRDDPERRSFTIHPDVMRLVGGINEAVFLENIIQWLPRHARDKEIYKSVEEIETETTLTKKQQSLARKNLIEIGALKERYSRAEHKVYFAIDIDGIDALLGGHNTRKQVTKGNLGKLPKVTSQVTKGNLASDERALGKLPKVTSYKEQGSSRELQESITAPRSKTPVSQPNPNVKVFIDWWCDRHMEVVKSKYMVNGGRDGSLVKKLLSQYPLEKVKETANKLLHTTDQWIIDHPGRTISTLYNMWNKLTNQGVSTIDGPSSETW